jgi:transcriptional regulator with XRE-family HTH domain
LETGDGLESVKRIREERGLSQRKLAKDAGINAVTLVRIEKGVGSPQVDTLEKLAEAMGVSVFDFFAEESTNPEAPAELPLETTPQRDSAIIKALRTYFWDLRFRWKEPGNKPSPEQIRDALDLLQHLVDHGAFEGPLTPREQSEVKILFNAAHKLRPLVEELVEEDEATWLRPMAEEVFQGMEKMSS